MGITCRDGIVRAFALLLLNSASIKLYPICTSSEPHTICHPPRQITTSPIVTSKDPAHMSCANVPPLTSNSRLKQPTTPE